MKKTAALLCVAFAGLLSACNPWAGTPADGQAAIDELCLNDGFQPCRDDPDHLTD